MRERPEGDLRSMGMEALCRVKRSGVGRGAEVPGVARSMRRTEAPASARSIPAKGPGARPANSRARRPVRGGGEVDMMEGLDITGFVGYYVRAWRKVQGERIFELLLRVWQGFQKRHSKKKKKGNFDI